MTENLKETAVKVRLPWTRAYSGVRISVHDKVNVSYMEINASGKRVFVTTRVTILACLTNMTRAMLTLIWPELTRETGMD